jgi:hypothetical protein
MKLSSKVIQVTITFLTVFYFNATSVANAEVNGLRDCKNKSDCIMIDIGCGQPGAVNKSFKKYTEAPGGCGASLNYDEESKRYNVSCIAGKCSLVPNRK